MAVAAAMALVGLAGPASAAPAQGAPQATVTRGGGAGRGHQPRAGDRPGERGLRHHVRAELAGDLPERDAAQAGRADPELLRDRSCQPRQLHRPGLRAGPHGGDQRRLPDHDRQQSSVVAVTFDEANAADGTSCCNEIAGPNNPTPGFSAILAPIYKRFGIPIPAVQTGGGQTGTVLFNPRYITPGGVNTTGSYNHYSALRSYEDILGMTTGGADGNGHIGFAARADVVPFGPDVFNATSPAAGLPELPVPIALPAAALGLGALAVVAARRRTSTGGYRSRRPAP